MLTAKDIQKLTETFQPIFATKKDLEKFATKEDLEKYATKVDLEVAKIELRGEIQKLATKEESTLKFDKVMTKLDSVYGELLKVREEQTVHEQRHQDIDAEIRTIKSLI